MARADVTRLRAGMSWWPGEWREREREKCVLYKQFSSHNLFLASTGAIGVTISIRRSPPNSVWPSKQPPNANA